MTVDTVFLDTNVLLRFLLADHPDHSPRARAVIASLARGEINLAISETVIFETVFTLEKHYGFTRNDIVGPLSELLSSAGVIFLGPADFRDAFDLYQNHRQLSIADCFHAAMARSLRSRAIMSFDRGFDRVEGLQRIEPPSIKTAQ